jgi:hypothetical protein
MPRYRITAPVTDFTGVSVGVNFTKGAAELEAPDDDRQDPMTRALAYFRAQGYGVEPIDETPSRSRKAASTSKGADQ